MTVRAFDLGTPSLYSDVNVRVFILDQNDHAPKVSLSLFVQDLRRHSDFFQFQTHKYWVDIPEDTPGGTPVLQVTTNI